MNSSRLSFKERARFCRSNIASKLFMLMDEKKSNLCVSADLTRSSELLFAAEELGPEICLLKTHIDILEDFTPTCTAHLKKIAAKHRFLLFEDRKFADIGHTVKKQYSGGLYRISDWADIVNAHAVAGPGVIEGIRAHPAPTALLLIAELSSKGHLMTKDYAQQTLYLAERYPEDVIGFITQLAPSDAPQWINLSPGVQIDHMEDELGQQYTTPDKAILHNGADIIIVGRGILKASDRLKAAKSYREMAYHAYLKRIEKIA